MINTNIYPVSYTPDCLTFEFMSDGFRGHIIKVVVYTPLHVKNYYNLGFGDKDGIRQYSVENKIISDGN